MYPRMTFVDAAALVAILAPVIPEDRLVGQEWQSELDAGATLVTTYHSLTKASVELQRSHGMAGLTVLHEVLAPALRVERCTVSDYERAVAALLATEGRGDDLLAGIDRQVRRRLRIAADLHWM